jgi:hypothetical protein
MPDASKKRIKLKPGPRTNVAPNRDWIIAQVMNGVELYDIAKKLKVVPSAISNLLAKEKDYQDARVQGLEQNLRIREIDLESAPDMVGVTRADKLLKLAQWRLERLVSAIYGQKVAVDSNVTINVVVNRNASLPDNSKVIEMES